METVGRGKRASENQKDFLINYLEEHLDIANDKFATADGAKFRERKWSELAVSLNALGGTQKDGPKWKKYWSDLRLHTRTKYSAIKQAEQRSGVNGLSRVKVLSSLEERVIQITTLEAVDGDNTPEVGFDETIASCRQIGDSGENFVEVEFLDNADSNIGASTSRGNVGARPRTRRQRGQQKDSHVQKMFEIEERKLLELEKANSLRERQVKALESHVEAVEDNTRANNVLTEKLSDFIITFAHNV